KRGSARTARRSSGRLPFSRLIAPPLARARGRQRRRTYGQSPHVLMTASTSAASCRDSCAERHALDVAERQLQEALAERTEHSRIARRQEPVHAEAVPTVPPVPA